MKEKNKIAKIVDQLNEISNNDKNKKSKYSLGKDNIIIIKTKELSND
tara:strand:+ start:21083 stop:21223 length:141 start_codon:yes stop_codon:yes gene_type:complete